LRADRGETAQMPGFYQAGEYDVSGTIVGVVEKKKMLDGPKTIRPGDAVLGLHRADCTRTGIPWPGKSSSSNSS